MNRLDQTFLFSLSLLLIAGCSQQTSFVKPAAKASPDSVLDQALVSPPKVAERSLRETAKPAPKPEIQTEEAMSWAMEHENQKFESERVQEAIREQQLQSRLQEQPAATQTR